MALKSFILKYWPSILVVLVIIYATLASDPVGADELPAIPHLDKLIHAVMMGGLVGAIAFDKQRSVRHKRILSWQLMWTIAGAVAVFSLVDEIAQGMMDNGRGTDPLDYVADCCGAAIAVYLAPPAIYKVLGVRPKTS